jgi:segregation and condensation protein B
LKKGFIEVEDRQLKSIIESLIFVSETPLSLERIKEVLGEVSKKDLQRLVLELIEEYQQAAGRGFFLTEVAEGYQFRTRPEYADWIRKLKKTKPSSLSQPALETLAIIAYRQPVTRMDVEKIRSVDCGGVLRTLLEKKLIHIIGRKDLPGKPLVYGTSKKFLEVFGLKDLASLPTLKDLEGLGPSSQATLFSEVDRLAEPPEGKAGELGKTQEGLVDEPPRKTAEDPL